MKSPALNRVLEKSTAETLAALSVGAFFRADNAELNRIYGALPCHGQASRHEFFIQHHAMTENILLWAVEYWKTHSLTQSMVALIVNRESMPMDVLGADLIQRANKAKLATLIEAMRRICTDAGISFEDVAAFVEVDTELDAKPIPTLIPEYVEMFGTGRLTKR